MKKLIFVLGAVWTCSLLWSTTAVGKAPWFDKKDCRNKQKVSGQSRVDRFRYDASGKLGESLWDSGRATCVLWITICGDRIFKSKEINTSANETCPPGLKWQSVPKEVCCDEWKQAKQSKQPCNPLTDIDCDGIENQEDDTPAESSTGAEDTKEDKKSGATPHADLAVALQAPHRFPLGVTPFAITVHNNGPGQAGAVRLSAGTNSGKFVYATTSQGNCRVTESTVNCEFGNVDSDDGRSASVQMRTVSEGKIVVTADVTSGTPDMITANNHAKATIEVKKAVKGTWSAPNN